MTHPTYYTPDGYSLGAGIPVFVDPPQHSGETMPYRRIEVYTKGAVLVKPPNDPTYLTPIARSFTGKRSVPCAVPEMES